MAAVAEHRWRLALAEAVDREALLPQTQGEPHEVAVARYQGNPIQAPLVKEVHGVDRQRDSRPLLHFPVRDQNAVSLHGSLGERG